MLIINHFIFLKIRPDLYSLIKYNEVLLKDIKNQPIENIEFIQKQTNNLKELIFNVNMQQKQLPIMTFVLLIIFIIDLPIQYILTIFLYTAILSGKYILVFYPIYKEAKVHKKNLQELQV